MTAVFDWRPDTRPTIGLWGADPVTRANLAERLFGSRWLLGREPAGMSPVVGLTEWAGVVIAAVTPETRDVVCLAWVLGLPPPIGWVTTDTDEREFRGLLTECGWPADDLPVFRRPEVADLVAALEANPPPPPPVEGPLRLPVEEVLTVRGRGLVAVGRIKAGTVRVGDELEAVGPGGTVRTAAVAIEMFGRPPLESAAAPDHCGVLLRGLAAGDVACGDVLATPGTLRAVTSFTAAVYRMPGGDDVFGLTVAAAGLETGGRSIGVVSPLDEYLPALPAGRPVLVHFLLTEKPLPLWPGAWLTFPERGDIGVGRVVSV